MFKHCSQTLRKHVSINIELFLQHMTYPIENFTSKCCNAFNYFDNNEIHCSRCKKTIKTIHDTASITVALKYNMNHMNVISDDIVREFNENAAKYAHEKSCETISKTCPKCKNKYAKYLRNPRGDIIYVCCSCRHVFCDDGDVI